MSDEIVFRYQEIPQQKLQAKIFTNWSSNDLIVLAIGTALVILSFMFLTIDTTMMVVVAVYAPLIRFSKGYGRLYSEMYLTYTSWYVNTLLGGVWWQKERDKSWIRRLLRRLHGVAIPLRFARVSSEFNGVLERFGLLQQTDRPYDFLYVKARGGAFASLDQSVQADAVSELANIVNAEIIQSDLKVGSSYLRITSPYNPNEVQDYLLTSMNPLYSRPELFVPGDKGQQEFVDRMRANANFLRPAMTKMGGASNWFLIVLSIKRPLAFRWAQFIARLTRRDLKLNSEKIYDLPILELGRSLVETLSHSTLLELRDTHCLTLPELGQMVRSSWDIANMPQYFQEQAEGIIPTTDEQIDEWIRQNPGKDYASYLKAWPQKIIKTSKKDNYIQMDDTYISTLRVTGLPRRMRSDQALSIHSRIPPGMWTRQAFVAESVKGRVETQQLVYGTSLLMNLQQAFMSNRMVEDPFIRDKKNELAKQTDMISAHSISQYFNGVYPVLATSPEALRDHRKKLRGILSNVGFKTEIVKGSVLQREAGITGMLGINRL